MIHDKKIFCYKDEYWVDIPSTNGRYQASNFGRIRSMVYRFDLKRKTPLIIRPDVTNNGYFRCAIRDIKENGYKVIYRLAHRLIAESFHIRPDGKNDVNHIDGDKKNNRPENLEWCTASENNIHGWKYGQFDTILSLSEKEIMDVYNSELPMRELKKIYKVHENVIRSIRGAKRHTRITGATVSKNQKIISKKEALLIYKSSKSLKEIMAEFNVSKTSVWMIKSGRTFSNITGQKLIRITNGTTLSDEQILEIKESTLFVKDILRKYKISFKTLKKIKNGTFIKREKWSQ